MIVGDSIIFRNAVTVVYGEPPEQVKMNFKKQIKYEYSFPAIRNGCGEHLQDVGLKSG